MTAALGAERPARIGIAMSGGGDSMALALLLSHWAPGAGVALAACSVDHQLRPEAREELALAGAFCVQRAIPQTVRVWDHGAVQGNLQDAARRARYSLLADWAREAGIRHVVLGHTRDDQAETVLMRLARGSGVDGLAAMQTTRESDGVTWLRPMLGLGRDALRELLTRERIAWAEDPSNEDLRFDRIRARQLLATLEGLGITRAGLSDTAAHMARAREVLERNALGTAKRIAQVKAGTVIFEAAELAALPRETHTRLVSAALSWISRNPYRPRYEALMRALEQDTATLHGCLLQRKGASLIVTREPAACQGPCAPDQVWDTRWVVTGPFSADAKIAALGEAGLTLCPDWRGGDLPRAALLASPGVWQGGNLIAAPLAGAPNGFTAKLAAGCDDFYDTLVTH